MKIKSTFIMLAITLLLMGSSTGFAAKKFKFNASDTFVFDPFGVGGGFAQWLDGIGEGDSPNCRTNFGLLLQKSPSTETVLAAGTELEGLSGAVVTDDDT